MKTQDGYTLIELLVVTAIISVLAAAALPQFYPFKTRAYDTDAKSNLHNVFQSCKGYWAFNSGINPCLLSTVSNNEYGFIQSDAVEITIAGNANNTESDFSASGSHIWSSNVFMIDYRGVITSTSGGTGGNNVNTGNNSENNSGNNSNAGNNSGNNSNAGNNNGNNSNAGNNNGNNSNAGNNNGNNSNAGNNNGNNSNAGNNNGNNSNAGGGGRNNG